jgi:hypothetical protein
VTSYRLGYARVSTLEQDPTLQTDALTAAGGLAPYQPTLYQPAAFPPASGYAPYPVVAPRSNGMATAGGTVGIVGAVLSLIPLIGIPIGLLMGLLAVIFSSVGLSRTGAANVGKGMAVTGLVLGILTLIFKLIPGVNLL